MQDVTSPPRVLLVSTVHPATDPRIVGKIASSLQQHFEVQVLLPEQSDSDEFFNVRFPFFKRIWQRVLVAQPVILLHFLRTRPQFVHIFVAELLPLAFVFQWLGAEVIYEVQENLYKKIPLKTYNRGWLWVRLFQFFDQRARKRFKFVFTEDAYLNEYHNLTKSYAVVHNFAASHWLSVPSPVPNLDQPTFFYAGVISIERAFDTLLKAIVVVKKKYPSVRVQLFGPVRIPNLTQLEGYQEAKENLIFYGYQSQSEAFVHAREALAGIALLKPVGDYVDSYPTKLFDYMALALPVITSDLPLLTNVVNESQCGFCVNPYDSDALAEQLIRCIENPENLKKMGESGRNAIKEKYNWDNEVKKLIELYQK